jgi:hypothetical protein
MNKQRPRAASVPAVLASPRSPDGSRRGASADVKRLVLVEHDQNPLTDAADRDRSDVPRSRPLFI